MTNQNAKISDFQFSDPRVTQFEFHLNKGYEAKSDQDSLPVSFQVQKNQKRETNQFIELTMKIGNEDSPFTFHAVIGADFSWKADLDDKTVEELLNKNAVSLLIGYLRPIVSQFTVQAGLTPLNIPFINLN